MRRVARGVRAWLAICRRSRQTIKDNFVSAHTFRFITPLETAQSGIPNPCTSCHKDKSTDWAAKELRGWGTASPWRVAQ